jgi:hypothetical protein
MHQNPGLTGHPGAWPGPELVPDETFQGLRAEHARVLTEHKAAEAALPEVRWAKVRGEATEAELRRAEAAELHARIAVQHAARALFEYLHGPEWNGHRESVQLPPAVLAEPVARETEARTHAAELRAAAREADAQAERAARLVRWLSGQATGMGDLRPSAEVEADETVTPEPLSVDELARAMQGHPLGPTAPSTPPPSEREDAYREAWEKLNGPLPGVRSPLTGRPVYATG